MRGGAVLKNPWMELEKHIVTISLWKCTIPQITENFLTAQRVAAEQGDVKKLIQLTEYLRKFLDGVEYQFIDDFPEYQKKGSKNPVDNLQDFDPCSGGVPAEEADKPGGGAT